jgi:N-acetylmuramidase
MGGILMGSAATFNRQAWGKIWNLQDLPEEFSGCQILLQGDLDHDLSLAPEELDKIDWIAFSEAVGEFQARAGLAPRDGKLGPVTLRRLREFFGTAPQGSEILMRLGEMAFRPASVPVSEPPGPLLMGRTPEERSIAGLWNRYGAVIYRQARAYRLPVETALAVFFVESQTAYDPRTGLVIIRFEPQTFRRKAGQDASWSRGGQQTEWRNLAEAFELDADAALLSTSYGLPQLMGFNWQVTRHPSARAMVLAFQDSCEEQVAGFFDFVDQNGLIRSILNGDWRGFTRRYNGPGNVEAYSQRLIRAFEVVNTLKEDGARLVA